jgi:uncharacterized protein YjbJ (UPF0337 family)
MEGYLSPEPVSPIWWAPATPETSKERDMGANMDEAKGRMKEAAGDLTDDDDMKREGKADRMGATVKEKADQVVDKAKDIINKDR